VHVPGFVKTLLPSLLLKFITSLMPIVVEYSVRWHGSWYRSEENHSIMRKSFWYLWLIVIIFPTLGLTTGLVFLEQLFRKDHPEVKIRWECVFLSDSGAFFINYVMTVALIGSGLELIRFPDMFMYVVRVCFSRSKADKSEIERKVKSEFSFGKQYAEMLLMFAMVTMFSIPCPLITPFGFLYFILNYLVDKHNLALVYKPSKINKNIHRTAINLVIFNVTLLQAIMACYSLVRSWDGTITRINIRTGLSLLLLFVSILIFSAQVWASFCKKLSIIRYVEVLLVDEVDDHQELYIPEELKTCYQDDVNDNRTEENEDLSFQSLM